MKALLVVLAVALLAGCAATHAPPRNQPTTLGDCIFQRGGMEPDWGAVMSCQSEVDRNNQRKKVKP